MFYPFFLSKIPILKWTWHSLTLAAGVVFFNGLYQVYNHYGNHDGSLFFMKVNEA